MTTLLTSGAVVRVRGEWVIVVRFDAGDLLVRFEEDRTNTVVRIALTDID